LSRVRRKGEILLRGGYPNIAIEEWRTGDSRGDFLDDFELSMWRHFVFLPVAERSGRRAACGRDTR
jgi:hypothetical protein